MRLGRRRSFPDEAVQLLIDWRIASHSDGIGSWFRARRCLTKLARLGDELAGELLREDER